MNWFKSFWKKPKTPAMGYMWGAETPPASEAFSNFIRFSQRLGETAAANNETIRWLTSFEGARLLLPKRFAPDAEFLKRHAEKCLTGRDSAVKN